jgi:periplasmic divalent cation tolerance protein
MGAEVLLAISTFPDAETARRIAEQLVAQKLAACANITAPVQSIYRWEGKVENAAETMVFFKTTESRFADFEAALRSQHPYDVPEVIALRVSAGSSAYLEWVEQSCRV